MYFQKLPIIYSTPINISFFCVVPSRKRYPRAFLNDVHAVDLSTAAKSDNAPPPVKIGTNTSSSPAPLSYSFICLRRRNEVSMKSQEVLV